MQRAYLDYKSEMENRIEACISELKSQPILFVGTGLSIRYFGAPNWTELLRKISEISAIERDYEFYEQTKNNEREIAEEFAQMYNEWAWNSSEDGGKDQFPPWLFDGDAPEDIYLKYEVANLIRNLTPSSISDLSNRNKEEIELLKDIQPHAVITTNYDTFLEDFIFQDYERVIGQRLIEEPFANIGEIFKIHGCVTRPSEIVLTESDFTDFDETKNYLSAKLLTFFTEHPVLIVGYRPNDPNVKKILSDVKSAIETSDRQPNIFLVDWESDIPESGNFNQERLIDLGDGDQMTVNYIIADDFDWVFDAFSGGGEIKGVNSKLLRKLLNNTYDIVREEAPRREIAFSELESVADNKDNLLNIFGISPLDGEDGSVGNSTNPSSIAEAGVPVGQIISDEDVDNLDDILTVAVESWNQYDVLMEHREAIYTFYKQRRELELTNEKIDFLYRSSIINNVQGSEWLIRYEGDIDNLLTNMHSILNGRNIANLERNLLILGKSEHISDICDTELADSSYSNAERYLELCEEPLETRVREYVGESIRFQDTDYSVDDLLSGNESIINLLDDIVDSLIADDQGPTRRAFRNIELVRIANSPLGQN
ncbi:unknown [Haloarcula marismortui ATCC 43049]|uniref:Uncharacterized protein n=1 Tax=Haloarcula marismortui (strain ATCC 43049 / DSM 3752 / JCM 8966 / VKM B-1809) TaxID=272569 RepID=Q5V033_HALMA|nr:SIR2 family protein [Haloarcula marismortui]AAV47120.1 unknown [Haloarcula marismortui ATCC 43049]QCP91824.1 hypothetical protein E6P14_13510 [Haloarcula marismortui ATCC 43049]